MTLIAALAYQICLNRRGVSQLRPTTQQRFNVIYNATTRGKRIEVSKVDIFNALQPSLIKFDPAYLKSQPKYNKWFNYRVNRLKKLGLSFGYAQKFVNVLMKDWCAANVIAGQHFNYEFLHAPIDNIIATAVSRYAGHPSPVAGKGLYANLQYSDYDQLQLDLKNLGAQLKKQLSLNFTPTRLDTEQLIWGWV